VSTRVECYRVTRPVDSTEVPSLNLTLKIAWLAWTIKQDVYSAKPKLLPSWYQRFVARSTSGTNREPCRSHCRPVTLPSLHRRWRCARLSFGPFPSKGTERMDFRNRPSKFGPRPSMRWHVRGSDLAKTVLIEKSIRFPCFLFVLIYPQI
jgi:hypothetical protein